MSERSSEPRMGAVNCLDDPPSSAPAYARFADRRDAGRRLAVLLERFRDEHPVVIGIPRGGVPVAAEVARALEAPLDVTVVRKIGAPQNPEYAIGALAEGGVHVLSRPAVQALGLSDAELRQLLGRVQIELEERLSRFRGARQPIDLRERTVILVDDGLATGRSAMAAVASLRARGARRVIVAVPVAAPESAQAIRAEADEVVCVELPADLWAVGLWYEDFTPTSDREVIALLAGSDAGGGLTKSAASSDVKIQQASAIELAGDLTIPPSAQAIVVFAHGTGSSRLSPRNRQVAAALNQAGYATLLFDLLTSAEEQDRGNVFDIPLLAERLLSATSWLNRQPQTAGMSLGYFGASTGAAAALTAAAQLADRVGAVVSRGGRPDLALSLTAVRAATLLIVGGADRQVLELNRHAQSQLRCVSELAVVPGATHLFQEPGALERVSSLAIHWFDRHLLRLAQLRA